LNRAGRLIWRNVVHWPAMSGSKPFAEAIMKRTLVVIADSGKAKFLVHERPAQRLEKLPGLDMAVDVPPAREIMADRPGRSFSSVGPGRSAYEPKSDPRDLKEKEFSRQVTARIAPAMEQARADAVVIAAAPRALAEMRKALPAEVSGKLFATLDKDLTNTPENELFSHLREPLGL
jgi:protein required for attachment to host cells